MLYEKKKEMLQGYQFSWPSIEATIAGKSALDMPALYVKTRDQAYAFLKSYGFDLENRNEHEEVKEILSTAIYFIENVLLPYKDISSIDRSVVIDDPLTILVLASDKSHPLQHWYCSILRVCHAVTHARYLYGEKARAQIAAQVKNHIGKYIQRDGELLFLGDEYLKIPLYKLEFKDEKPWERLVLKLLHKAGNLGENVYDRLGMRLVSMDQASSLLIIHFLRSRNVISLIHSLPLRAKNNLIDLEKMKAWYDQLSEALSNDEITLEEFEECFKSYRTLNFDVENPPNPDHVNIHSADTYKAIQFTTRILYHHYDSSHQAGETFFFPFEVQILDKETYLENTNGIAEHEQYKQRQKRSAAKRIFVWA